MPALTTLFRRPDAFFKQLSRLPYRPARFLWVVLFSGVAFMLSMLSTEGARVSLRLALGEAWLFGTFLLVLQPVLQWLIFWGLGHLALGKGGRPAEVYGLTFIIPAFFSLGLLLWAVLFPVPLLTPAPDLTGLSEEMREQLARTYLGQVTQEPAQKRLGQWQSFLSYLTLVFQGVLGWYGFRQLTHDDRKALWGVVFPLGSFILLKLLRNAF